MTPATETTELQINLDPFTDLAHAVHATAVEKGWYEANPHFPEKVALMHSELSEALEDFRDGHDVTDIHYEDGKPCGVAVELADTIIRILDAAAQWNIPIQRALAEKIAYNMSRPHRHGGKVC